MSNLILLNLKISKLFNFSRRNKNCHIKKRKFQANTFKTYLILCPRLMVRQLQLLERQVELVLLLQKHV